MPFRIQIVLSASEGLEKSKLIAVADKIEEVADNSRKFQQFLLQKFCH